MAKLTENNSSVDKNSGAVMFHKSPELQELLKLKQEVKEVHKELNDLNNKLDTILEVLKGGRKYG